MKFLWMSASVVGLLLLSGCSSKHYYKPDRVKGEWRSAGHLSAPIAQVTPNGAVLENGYLLTKSGEKKATINKELRLLNVSDGWIITQNGANNVELIPQEGITPHVVIDVNKTVASASIQGDTLAVLFGSNEMALYSLAGKQMTFKESGSSAVAVDARIQSPYFLKNLVIFPTLDGKLVIVDGTEKKLLRSLIVGSDEYFNNTTYVNMIDNTMVAATGSSILAFSQKEGREKYDIRDVVYTDEGVWLTTKQGEVIALTPTLQYKAKKKFPFAHFVGLSVSHDRVYVLEQGGYLIALSKNLLSSDVYSIDMDNDTIFMGEGRAYFDDRYIDIK
jgi:hypothetical protein